MQVLAMVDGSDKSFNILNVHHMSGTVYKIFLVLLSAYKDPNG